MAPTRPENVTVSPVSRALDPLALAYAIYRGLEWRRTGVEFYRNPSGSRGSSRRSEAGGPGKGEIVSLARALVEKGLLVILPHTAVEHKGMASPYYYLTSKAGKAGGGCNGQDVVVIDEDSEDSLPSYNSLSFIVSRVGEDVFCNVILEAAREIHKHYSNVTGFKRVYFKTVHGEILRAVENAAPLPERKAVARVNLLPMVISLPPTPLLRTANDKFIDVNNLRNLLKEYFEEKFEIDSQWAGKAAEILVEALKNAGINSLDEYQYKMLESYLSKSKEKGKGSIVILDAPTGSGKTIIFTIIALARRIGTILSHKKGKTLIIYPRKTLAYQQLERLANLVAAVNRMLAKLPYARELEVAFRDNESLTRESWKTLKGEDGTPMRGLKIREDPGGEAREVKHWIEEDRKCYGSDPSWLYDVKESVDLCSGGTAVEAADIIITNYAIAFKMFLESFDPKGGALGRILDDVDQVILDEAHVYLEQKHATMITPVILNIASKRDDYDVIVSSASIANYKYLPDSLSTENLVAIVKKSGGDRGSIRRLVEAITGLDLKKLEDRVISEDYDRIRYDSLRGGEWKSPVKITMWSVATTMPDRRSSTALEESLVALMHAMAALRRRAGAKAVTLAFIDHKDELLRIADYFVNRIILEAGDHYDRVLLTALKKRDEKGADKEEDSADMVIIDTVKSRLEKGANLAKAIWDLKCDEKCDLDDGGVNLSSFHALSFYLGESEYYSLKETSGKPDEEWSRKLGKVVGDWLDKVRVLAEITREHGAYKLDSKVKDLIRESKRRVGKLFFIVHHGDIHASRPLLDERISSGEPLLVMSTSTLEVGIDVPGVYTVIQYSDTAPQGSPMQRVGRAGRDKDSLFTSQGILILKNTEEDIRMINEKRAFDYLFSFRFDLPERIPDSSVATARLAVTVVARSAINSTLSSLKSDKLIKLNKCLNVFHNKTSGLASRLGKNVIDLLTKYSTNSYEIRREAVDKLRGWKVDVNSVVKALSNVGLLDELEIDKYQRILLGLDHGLDNYNNLLKDYKLPKHEIIDHVKRDIKPQKPPFGHIVFNNIVDTLIRKYEENRQCSKHGEVSRLKRVGELVKEAVSTIFNPDDGSLRLSIPGTTIYRVLWEALEELPTSAIASQDCYIVIDSLSRIIRSLMAIVAALTIKRAMQNINKVTHHECREYLEIIAGMIYPGALDEVGEPLGRAKVIYITAL